MKLSPEAVRELGDDPERLDRVRGDADKRLIAAPQGFSNERLPLAAIYVLANGETFSIEPLRPADAVIELLAHSWTPRSLHASEPASRLARYTQLVERVPVRRLRRSDALGSVHEFAAFVEREAGGAAT